MVTGHSLTHSLLLGLGFGARNVGRGVLLAGFDRFVEASLQVGRDELHEVEVPQGQRRSTDDEREHEDERVLDVGPQVVVGEEQEQDDQEGAHLVVAAIALLSIAGLDVERASVAFQVLAQLRALVRRKDERRILGQVVNVTSQLQRAVMVMDGDEQQTQANRAGSGRTSSAAEIVS